MSVISRWLGRLGSALARHLGRLRDALDDLAGQVREAVAAAVGRVASEAAREAVQAALGPPGPAPPSARWSRADESSFWAEPEGYRSDRWAEDEADPYGPEYVDDDGPTRSSRRRGWRPALLAGCRAASWWLRRHEARFPVMYALGLGLLSWAASRAGGVLFPDAGLLGSALGLADLAQAGLALT